MSTEETELEMTPTAPTPELRVAVRLRRWFVSAALALILAAMEVGGERSLRVPTPIILLRDNEFAGRFPRIRPYRAHYRRHSPTQRKVGSS